VVLGLDMRFLGCFEEKSFWVVLSDGKDKSKSNGND
jgi:hypothetical protein